VPLRIRVSRAVPAPPLSTVFREQPIISATRLASMRVFFVIKLIALVLASRRCRDPQPRSSPILDIFSFESPPISLTVVLPTSRVSFRLFIGGCLSVSPRTSQFVVGHVLCRADLGHGSYRSFLVLLRFIGEKAGVYRMTAKPLIGASVRSKNEMLEISNTPTGRLSIPDHSVRCQLTLLEKISAGNARNLAFITKATPLNELQLVVH
jgi:hypothetical protein